MIGLVDGNNFFVSCERVFNPKLIGKPVAVLSNNDGCCVSRSNEFKALGIAMGTPYFQLREREYPKGELIFLSSNFELYGDMSRRMISVLREMAIEVEQYSIDEAFIYPPSNADLEKYGCEVRETVLKWVGIPCGVGFAQTKTLAKIANHIAKKLSSGVFVLDQDSTKILSDLPAGEVWGVGRRLTLKLKAEKIFTAKDLRDADDETLRRIGGITLLRTAQELRGISSYEERDYDEDPESITCSRTFGEQITDKDSLMESIAVFTAQAAVKLRRHSMLASGCNVYAQLAIPGAAGRGGFLERTVVFPRPTDATNEMHAAIRPIAESLFINGSRYRKSGITFFGLEKEGRAYQSDLFSMEKHEASKSYAAIDKLNRSFGAKTVFSASEGIGPLKWQMKRDKISKRATTDWRELMTVK